MAETVTKLPVGTEEKRETAAPATQEAAWMMPFESLRREVDRLFEDFRPMGWRLPFGRPSVFETTWPRSEALRIAPAMDLVEKKDAFEITAELPGLDEKNVEVKLAGGILTIRGEKKEESTTKEKDYHLSERRFGSFQRQFRLPEGVDPEGIEAKFVKGVLTVTMPKTPEAKASEKKIAVKTA